MSGLRLISLSGLAGLLFAGVAHATPGAGTPGPLVNTPPPDASDAPSSGDKAHVVLRCTVNADRSVDHCTVVSETPSGQGLGEAALRLAPDIRVNPETFESGMVGSRVDVPLSFSREPIPDDMPDGVAAMPSP
jgi:hypothetical protein